MVAAQSELVAAAEPPQLAVHVQPQDVVAADAGEQLFPAGPLGAAGHGREPPAPCRAAETAGGQLGEDPVVVGAQERDVVRRLVLEDAQLGVHVGAVGTVAGRGGPRSG